jgi:hypothetical protein
MAPGFWNVFFERCPDKPNWTAKATDSLEIVAGKTAKADFHVGPARVLSGRVIDAEKQTPVSGVAVGYYGTARPRSGAACLMEWTDAQGRFKFNIPPGESYVYVASELYQGKQSSRALIVEPNRDPPPVILKATPEKNQTRETAATEEAAPFDKKQGETAPEDKPYTVSGTVTDRQGRPLKDVLLRAHCGSPTLYITGQTTSDEQGRYTLRFRPGVRIYNESTKSWRAGGFAHISASKAGYVEKNNNRHSQLTMGNKPSDKGDSVVLPGQPRQLNFVMIRSLNNSTLTEVSAENTIK